MVSNLIPHPRKLPPNCILASLLCRGWTSREIAQRYGTTAASVNQMRWRRGFTMYDRHDFTPLDVVAAELGVSRNSLSSYVRRRRVLFSRFGGRIGFTEKQMEAVRAFYAQRDPAMVEKMKAAHARRWL